MCYNHNMILTKRTKIVPLSSNHLEIVREIRMSEDTWHWLTDSSPISDLQQKQWFESLSKDKSKMFFVAISSRSGEIIGILRSDEIDRANRSIRIGVDIESSARGNGYGTEIFQAFINYLFHAQNFNRIWLLVVESNLVAKKLYKKLGFKEEGVQRDAIYREGKYHNYVMMSILSKEFYS